MNLCQLQQNEEEGSRLWTKNENKSQVWVKPTNKKTNKQNPENIRLLRFPREKEMRGRKGESGVCYDRKSDLLSDK